MMSTSHHSGTLNQSLRHSSILHDQSYKKNGYYLLTRGYVIFFLIYINLKVTENASQYTIQPDNKVMKL